MLNFQDNFFFAKFTIFFFILTIFGYWGIDLNSEELYIAFSFFLLVILGVILSRKAIMSLFIKSVNSKYFRILSDLLVIVSGLTLRVVELRKLLVGISSLEKLLSKLNLFVLQYLASDFGLTADVLSARFAFLSVYLKLNSTLLYKNISRLRKFQSFSGAAQKFFSIKF